MKKYQVKVTIGGREYKYVVESPTALSASEARAQARKELAEPQKLRSFLQGTTLGFGEEIEAGAKSLGGEDYTQERDRLRAQLSQFREDSPLTSMGLEIAGTIPTTIAAARAGAPAAAVPMSRIGQLAMRAAPLAAESALAAYGYTEGDTAKEQALDTLYGTVLGTAGGGLASAAMTGLGALGKNFMSFVREKLGDKASDSVQAELQRLVDIHEKNPDEILADVADGIPISDNKTLIIALKNYVNQGGQPARDILEKTKSMAQQRKGEAISSLESGLTGGQSGNQLQRGLRNIEEMKRAEREMYQGAFTRSGEPSTELVNQMQDIIRRFPEASSELNTIYRARNLVPLFATDSAGAINLVRQPTAEDAEILYRTIRDFTGQAYTGGRGTIGEVASEATESLKGQIGQDFPAVERARQVSAGRFAAQEAFESGRKALTKDPEEIDIMIQKMSESQIKAFRAGLMNALNRRMQTGTTFRDLADENKNIGKVLRLALRPEDVDAIVNQMSRTAESVEIAQKMPSTAGSPTAPLQQEARASGSGQNLMQAVDAMSGSPYAMMQVIQGLLEKNAPQGLSTEQRQQVVDVIFSQDPELVRRALTDQTALAELEKKIVKIADTMGKSLVRGAQQQTIQESQE